MHGRGEVVNDIGLQRLLRRRQTFFVTSLPVFSPFREHGEIPFVSPTCSWAASPLRVVLMAHHHEEMR